MSSKIRQTVVEEIERKRRGHGVEMTYQPKSGPSRHLEIDRGPKRGNEAGPLRRRVNDNRNRPSDDDQWRVCSELSYIRRRHSMVQVMDPTPSGKVGLDAERVPGSRRVGRVRQGAPIQRGPRRRPRGRSAAT